VCCEVAITRGQALPAAALGNDVHTDLTPAPTAAGVARRFVLDSAGELDESAADTLALLTSEMVTNGILHARTPLELGVNRHGDEVLVALADKAPTPIQHRDRDLQRPDGRGLQLIDALAARWGMEWLADGKVVWFVVPVVGLAGGGGSAT
jgi:two-component sensor histidine kinase